MKKEEIIQSLAEKGYQIDDCALRTIEAFSDDAQNFIIFYIRKHREVIIVDAEMVIDAGLLYIAAHRDR